MANGTQTNEKNYPPIVIVAGMSKTTQAIGKENGLLWYVKSDMQRFKELTMGHPVIMGRKTFESIVAILGKPLPGRTNIVVTRDGSYAYEGVRVAHSLPEALTIAEAEHPTEIHIGGGEELYRQALPLVSRLHVTWFFSDQEGDTHFPGFLDEFTPVTEHEAREEGGVQFQWVDYERKRS